MSKNEIITKIDELNEWQALMEEAREMADSIRDELKAFMLANEAEEMECGQYILRYQTIVSNKLDSSAFKKMMPDVYKSFIRQSVSKRFSIA